MMAGFFHKQASEKPNGSGSGFHSRSFHKYFEGYSEVCLPNGKIQRVYTGTYYCRICTDRQWTWVKVRMAALYFVSAALFTGSSAAGFFQNSADFIGILQAISLLALFWLLYVLIHYLVAPKSMTIGTYNAVSPPMRRAATASCTSLAGTAGATLVYMLAEAQQDMATGLLCFLGYLFAAVAVLGMGLTEARAKYDQVASSVRYLDGGVEIDS